MTVRHRRLVRVRVERGFAFRRQVDYEQDVVHSGGLLQREAALTLRPAPVTRTRVPLDSQAVAMQVEFINPPELCPTFGWTHLATVAGGRTIYISGQVAVDADGRLVGLGDLQTQTEQTFKNLALALAAAGATFEHVVKTNLYVVGLKAEHVPILREVRSRFVSQRHPPVSTLVGVQALVGPDWLIEIEAVAVVPV